MSDVTIASGCVVDEPEQAASSADARLHGVRELLVALGNALANRFPEDDLEAQFEQHVRQMLGLRSVRLREVRARYQARLVTPTRTNDSIVLGVPGSDARVQAVLEASCDPGRRFDEHDLEVLTAVAQIGGLVMEIARCRAPARARPPVSVAPLIGSTPVMQSLRERVERVAATDFTVLVEGESGTGKELVARQVHELSRRRNGPFVAVNCAAVVETLLEAELFGIEERTATGVRGRRGKFEHADGGTLFLDEVSDLSLSAQAKLLRVIQDLAVERVGGQGVRRVNTRIIAATNRPLSELTVRGAVPRGPVLPVERRRNSRAAVAQPPRGHSGAGAVLSRSASTCARADAVAAGGGSAQSARLAWQRSRTRASDGAGRRIGGGDRIELDDLPAVVRGEYEETLGPALAGNESFRRWGSRYARLVFERCGRNKRRACRVLDISYHTLQAYLRYSDRRAREQAKQLPAWVRSASDATDGDAESGA